MDIHNIDIFAIGTEYCSHESHVRRINCDIVRENKSEKAVNKANLHNLHDFAHKNKIQ
jgi:hypothetical protein